MLITNGFIKAQTVSGGGTDSNGFPITVTESWGDAIECKYQTNNRNDNGVASAGSAFTLHSYEVLIAKQPFATAKIQLYDQVSGFIGEFMVIAKEKLRHVDLIKIMV